MTKRRCLSCQETWRSAGGPGEVSCPNCGSRAHTLAEEAPASGEGGDVLEAVESLLEAGVAHGHGTPNLEEAVQDALDLLEEASDDT